MGARAPLARAPTLTTAQLTRKDPFSDGFASLE